MDNREGGKVATSVQLPIPIYEWVSSEAKKGHRSKNGQIVMVLEDALVRSLGGLLVKGERIECQLQS